MRFPLSALLIATVLIGCSDDTARPVFPATDAGPPVVAPTPDAAPPDAAPTADAATDAGGGARLDPSALDKFVDPVARPTRLAGYNADGSKKRLTIGMFQIKQKLHKQLPPTRLWAYGLSADQASYPGPTIDARPGNALEILWQNRLPDRHFLPVDKTIPLAAAAKTGAGVPTVVHVHGGLQESASDGHPEAWFTNNFAQTGPAFVKKLYRYDNENDPELLWYHDHAFGVTRLNVYAGLAGFYLLRDPKRESRLKLPSGKQDLEVVLQDRSFNEDGSLYYPNRGDNPRVHPNWVPEFFGDVNLVNGVVWPYLEVEPKRYRFRVLNGANARFYRLRMSDDRSFFQIGTDGGFLAGPIQVKEILLGPGERADVIVDFAGLQPGEKLELRNNARAPFPSGDRPDENTSRVMQFRVVAARGPDNSVIPPKLDNIPALGPPARTRTMTLIEIEDRQSGQPVGLFLNGKSFGNLENVTVVPQVGTTEVWELVNLTQDAHPIHLHLVDFRIRNRQQFDAKAYRAKYTDLNPRIPAQSIEPLKLKPYLRGDPQEPAENEAGWKDTVVVPPGQVTRFLVRWTPERGGAFPFDVTAGPGYVWHCHILEHEDNAMMQRFKLVAPQQQ